MKNPPAVDHENKNGFDNRRRNLRSCNDSLNQAHSASKNKHGFRGIFKNYNKWGAYIRVNQKYIFLGNHETKEKAAASYDVAAIRNFGEFATLNFPQA